jgi:hypothetical protein
MEDLQQKKKRVLVLHVRRGSPGTPRGTVQGTSTSTVPVFGNQFE